MDLPGVWRQAFLELSLAKIPSGHDKNSISEFGGGPAPIFVHGWGRARTTNRHENISSGLRRFSEHTSPGIHL
jgi:hypothetical protein